MGKKLGAWQRWMRDVEKTGARAAADAHRRDQREEATHGRAVEREQVRRERARERASMATERARERARLAAERDQARREKLEEKEAQLQQWQLEVEEHQERDRTLLEIANEGPEVEQRQAAFEEMMLPRAFEPPDFAPPAPVAPDLAKVRHLDADENEQIRGKVGAFKPGESEFDTFFKICLAIAAVGLIGLVVVQAVPNLFDSRLPLGLLALCAVAAIWNEKARGASTDEKRAAYLESLRVELNAKLIECTREANSVAVAQSAERVAEARKRHGTLCTMKAAGFSLEEARRIEELRQLVEGDRTAMQAALADLLPLDLHVKTQCAFSIETAEKIVVDIELPGPAVLQTREAKLTAAGKVTYKDKPPKRLSDEYQRVACGLALRYACEVMFNLATSNLVMVRCWDTQTDASTGRPRKVRTLDAKYDYHTLAGLALESVDPVAALKHFPHTLGESDETESEQAGKPRQRRKAATKAAAADKPAPVAIDLANAACPYCATALAAEPIVLCGSCQAPHHSRCWAENGETCTVYGCGNRP